MIRKKHWPTDASTANTLRKSPRTLPPVETESLILETLSIFATSTWHCERFLNATGLDVAALGAAARDGSLKEGLRDYIMTDEALLRELAERVGQPPEAIAAALGRPEQHGDAFHD